jgi:hypothetical protein
MPTVGDAGMEAVPAEIVHLVDVNRPRKQRMEDPAGGIAGGF